MKKRVFCLSLCLLLLLGSALGAAGAAGPDVVRDTEYIVWKISEDRTVITGNGRTYTQYQNQQLGSTVLLPESYYLYANNLDFLPPGKEGAYELVQIEAARRDAEVIWLEYEGAISLYATDSGKKQLDGHLASREASDYRMLDAAFNQVQVERELMDQLLALRQSSSTSKSYKSTALEGKNQYRVGGMEEGAELFLAYGVIYSLADGYYFLDLAEEEKTYRHLYDEEEIYTIYKLDDKNSDTVKQLIDNLEYVEATVTYEEHELWGEESFEEEIEAEEATGVLLVMLVLFGLVAPLVPIAFGLLLPLSKRLKHPKHWYALAIAGGLWLITAIVLLILILMI